MVYSSLDSIVRKILLKQRKSLHWYIDYIVAAAEVLKELTIDDLLVINTKLIATNSYNAIELPDDYLDFCKVGVQVGQMVKPLVPTDKINRLIKRDSSFNPIKYTDSGDQSDETLYYGIVAPFYYNTITYNEYGENTGRLFGYGAGVENDTFKVVKERGQIQINENLVTDFVLLEYISDGQSVDAATKIDANAESTITAYIEWQAKENSRTFGDGEKERARLLYIGQRKILRARLSDVTIPKLKRIVQRNTIGAPKN